MFEDPTLLSSSCVSSLSASWENMHSSLLTQFPVVWNSLQGNSRKRGVKEKHSQRRWTHLNSKINTNSSHFQLGAWNFTRHGKRCTSIYASLFVWSLVKDIMHVRTVVGSGTKSSDVELAQLLLLGQLDVVAEVTVVPLERKGVIMKCLILTAHD